MADVPGAPMFEDIIGWHGTPVPTLGKIKGTRFVIYMVSVGMGSKGKLASSVLLFLGAGRSHWIRELQLSTII